MVYGWRWPGQLWPGYRLKRSFRDAPQPVRSRSPITSTRRIRKPVDLLRCVFTFVEIIVVAVACVAASATTTGIETDIVGAGERLPHTLLVVAPAALTLFAISSIPCCWPFGELVSGASSSGSPRRWRPACWPARWRPRYLRAAARGRARLYDAITMSKLDVSHPAALDGYLAALVAYAAVLGLGGRQARWRTALWLLIGLYAVVNLSAATTTVLSLLISVLIGGAIGLGVRYAAGVDTDASHRRGDRRGADSAGCPVSEMRRVLPRPATTKAPSPAATRRSRSAAAGSTSSCTTGTSRRPGCCTGSTGWCGCHGRCRAGRRCRRTARP